VSKLQRDLDNVTEQLGDAKVDKHDDNRRKKKQELVENFKKAYPGVVSFKVTKVICYSFLVIYLNNCFSMTA